jgi:hypothetical protein
MNRQSISHKFKMTHMHNSSLSISVKPVLFAALAVSLSGCSTLWNIDEDAPPSPPIREVRQIIIPADLNLIRPAVNPYTAAIAAAQQVAQPVGQPVPTADSVSIPAVDQVNEQPKSVQAIRSAKENTLFAPYFPTEQESKAPLKWETQPAYAFPWISGAEPSRVNEETVLGSGDRMIGRFFAQISYEKNIPLTQVVEQAPPVAIVKESPGKNANGTVLKYLKNKIFNALGASSVKEVQVANDEAKPVQTFVQCEGATCLDAARDALVTDAKAKNWEMLLNRRVSMHQSFQFKKNDRIILIEVSSNGKKMLDVEYALLPTQIFSFEK